MPLLMTANTPLNPPNPARYDTWYHSPRGSWIGDTEFRLLLKMLKPNSGNTLLDVGCGTGYFSRRFANIGLNVSGMDTDASMLAYAQLLDNNINYYQGDTIALPFAEETFDYCSAVTSLCFVAQPEKAIWEMLRVSRKGVVIGLLNREGRLYIQKYNRGAYCGARWDTIVDVKHWMSKMPGNLSMEFGSAVFFPSGNPWARLTEQLLSYRLRWGSFSSSCFTALPLNFDSVYEYLILFENRVNLTLRSFNKF